MTRRFFSIGASLALSLAAVSMACSSDEDAAGGPEPQGDAGVSTFIDSSSADDVTTSPLDAGADSALCSPAGWCETSLPDVDLEFKDVWVFDGRAFAVAESPTNGIKVLEWTDAAGAWTYIDDGTQNEPGLGKYSAGIWAPNENEVYYAAAPSFVYHGKRESSGWTWSRSLLEDHSPDADGGTPHDHGRPFDRARGIAAPALGVWGTSANEVYAWYANTIYRWKSESSSAPAWTAEYVVDTVDDPAEHVFFLGAAGTDSNGVWFAAARDRYPTGGSCVVLVHRTAQGYERIVDGTVSGMSCEALDGGAAFGGPDGWLTNLQVSPAGQVTGLKGARDVARMASDLSTTFATVPQTLSAAAASSLWMDPDAQPWLSSQAFVLRGRDVFQAGGFEISSISLRGGPLSRPMNRVRGSSNHNLWAVGVRYALHKTTP
ncbi:hypothetical protein AKJ09_01476 [Labilithrix luteola]|uniref:Uncharacterized protein n=1 Tax=Labilithrix luteola TaxID=1391654 RepID=A0A0K1PMS4_9BACT|nr:hypothetical protein [Labilithrix luteola]AKU94812.1 hypothetical protein AKJ09_01476 [Labilithrix luteola]